MAATNASKQVKSNTHAERGQAVHPASSQAESNGGLNFFSSQQWMDVLGAISIAAAHAAEERNYEQMVNYNGLSGMLSRRLGVTQGAGAPGQSPPLKARAAGA
jgi:hypothetical protein